MKLEPRLPHRRYFGKLELSCGCLYIRPEEGLFLLVEKKELPNAALALVQAADLTEVHQFLEDYNRGKIPQNRFDFRIAKSLMMLHSALKAREKDDQIPQHTN